MDSELGFSIILFLIVVFIVVTFSVLFNNWQEREECRLMKNSGFEIQVRQKMVVSQECYVKDNSIGKYIPYEKFRAFGG